MRKWQIWWLKVSITSYLQFSLFSWMSGPRSAFSLTPNWHVEKGKHSPGTISTLQIESTLWTVKCILYRTTDSSTAFLQASACRSLKRWLACRNQHQDQDHYLQSDSPDSLHRHMHMICKVPQAKSRCFTMTRRISKTSEACFREVRFVQHQL